MTVLREVFSIVLLFAPAQTETPPLMKDAMRLVTSYVSATGRPRYEIPTTVLMIGIRG